MDAILTVNSFGMEIVSGIIMGLETDTPQTADDMLAFIEIADPAAHDQPVAGPAENAAMVAPGETRLLLNDDETRDDRAFPAAVRSGCRCQCMREAYLPEKLYARYQYPVRLYLCTAAESAGNAGARAGPISRRGLTMRKDF